MFQEPSSRLKVSKSWTIYIKKKNIFSEFWVSYLQNSLGNNSHSYMRISYVKGLHGGILCIHKDFTSIWSLDNIFDKKKKNSGLWHFSKTNRLFDSFFWLQISKMILLILYLIFRFSPKLQILFGNWNWKSLAKKENSHYLIQF